MKNELLNLIDRLDAEHIRLLYIAALEFAGKEDCGSVTE